MLAVPPKTSGVLETALYVRDAAVSAGFYQRIFGFPIISDFGERGCALQAGPRHVLLLFKKGGSRHVQAPHDGDGELHVAFAISATDLDHWKHWLQQNNIPIEETVAWPLGGTSLYFRDPDRHLLEVATPGIWSIY
jgi:catechol 2,3-dioxygenase-like lactoylglutathione lyase family enzyme